MSKRPLGTSEQWATDPSAAKRPRGTDGVPAAPPQPHHAEGEVRTVTASGASKRRFSVKSRATMIGGKRPVALKRQRSAEKRSGKKLTVALKRQVSLPDDFESTTWGKLSELITAVHTRTPVSHSRQELYQGVEDMCIHKMAPGLYTKFVAACTAHVQQLVGSLATASGGAHVILGAVRDAWATHCEQMTLLRQVFMYLDRTYMTPNTPHRSLWALGLHLFSTAFTTTGSIAARTLTAVLGTVAAHRGGQAVDVPVLGAVVRMYVALGLYADDMHPPLVGEATAFYKSEGEEKSASLPLPVYLRHVASRLALEVEAGGSLVQPETAAAVVSAVDKHLLLTHVDALLESGFGGIIGGVLAKTKEAGKDLARLYRLLERLGAGPIKALRGAFLVFVRESATGMVGDTARDKEMVPRLLQLKDDMDVVVAESFKGDTSFAYALKTAFDSAVNSRGPRFPELLAKFTDVKLRSGNKADTEEQLETILDKVLVLFRVTAAKDVFEAYYKKDLAKRLLLDRSASTSMERGFLQRLKTECGAGFTAKLEGMFQDMETSSDLLEHFTASPLAKDAQAATGVSSAVRVLTGSHWPGYNPAPGLVLSPELAVSADAFTRFYREKFGTTRKLVWQHTLSRAVLKAVFPSGRKELSLSLYQALVLLQWNDGDVVARGDGEGAGPDGITFKALLDRTGLPVEEGKLAVMSMVLGKVRLLVKTPAVKSLAPDHVIKFNAGFKSKMARLKVNQMQLRETKKEVAETNKRIVKERQYQMDAAVVRIMKTRQALKHSQLMAETIQALRFPAVPTDIKKRIESLIERDYLERDEDDPTLYNYLA